MKKNLFVISESERERILGMHQSASNRHYLSEQVAVPPTPAATTPAAPAAPTTPAAPAPESKGLNIVNDKDYEYKKDGETYSFRIKQTPTSANVLALQKQGKYADWTVATGKGLEAIKKLNFNDETADSVKMPIAAAPTKVTSTQTQLASAGTPAPAAGTPAAGTPAPAAGAGGAPPLQGVVDTTNMASRKDIRQGYRQEKRDVRELEKELRQTQNTLQRMANKMTPEQTKQYQTKVAQLQNQINQSAR